MSGLTYDHIHPVDPILSNVMAGGRGKLELIAEKALPPVDVDPKNFAGKVEVETARPFMGQDQAVNLARGDLDNYAELSTAKPSYVDYRCQELSAKRTLAKTKLARAINPDKLKRREAAIVGSALRRRTSPICSSTRPSGARTPRR